MKMMTTPQFDLACDVVENFVRRCMAFSTITLTAPMLIDDNGDLVMDDRERFRELVGGLLHELHDELKPR